MTNWFPVLYPIRYDQLYAVESQKANLWFPTQSLVKSARTAPSEWTERAIWSLKSGLSSTHKSSFWAVRPPLYPTFSEGSRRGPRSSDPGNERSCLSHDESTFRNIGWCGCIRVQSVSKQAQWYHLLSILGKLFGQPCDYPTILMQLRCD